MKRRTATLVALVLITAAAVAQSGKPVGAPVGKKVATPSEPLPPLDIWMKVMSAGARAKWSLVVVHQAEASTTPVLATHRIDNFVTHRPSVDPAVAATREHQLTKKHHAALVKLLDDLRFVGRQPGQFLLLGDARPAVFLAGKRGPALVVATLSLDTTYNTLRSTSRSRAGRVFSQMVAPALKAMHEHFGGASGIADFGVQVAYGAQDFSRRDEQSPKAEVLTVVVSVRECARFANGEITEDELAEAADFYLADDTTMVDVRKIKPVLE